LTRADGDDSPLVGNDAPLVGIEEIRAAARTLRGITMRTPLVAFGAPEQSLFLKAESLQPIGAFKLRGAYVAMAALTPAAARARRHHVLVGQPRPGRRTCRRLLGASVVVVMPSNAPRIKRERVEADGAQVIVVGPDSAERQRVAEEIAAERGLAIIPAFDDDRIIAGQGTVGLEIAEDLPDLAAVLVPIGGGGLASGVASAIRALCPQARIIGVEPELAADARDSLARDEIVAWAAEDAARTIADGTRVRSLGRRTFAHLRALVDEIVTVSEVEIAAGVRLAAERSRLVVEPSGALAVAAMAFHGVRLGLREAEGSVVAVVSGGNVDPDDYRAYLSAPIPSETCS
jgi:threonine dehydratase